MKRNYQYLQGSPSELSGGNLPPKKLPKLDDSEIEKLYKYYTSRDKFHSKFKGTKRDYCSAVAELIENFYWGNNLDKVTDKLSGGVKSLELIRRERGVPKRTLAAQATRLCACPH